MSEEKFDNDLERFFREDQENVFSKLPFDEEPIERGGYRYRVVNRSGANRRYEERKRPTVSKQIPVVLYLIIGILFVFNIVVGIMTINVYNKDKGNQSTTNISYPMNSKGVSGSLQVATSKALLSSVAIGATMSNVPILSENDFYNNNNSFGSGVVIGVDKLNGDIFVVTNYHVIYQVTEDGTANGYFNNVSILLPDSIVPIKVELVGGSANYDVAVLKASANNEVKKSKAISATFADSTEIRIGQECIAIGNSRALGLQATSGSISVEEEVLGGKNAGKNVNFMLLRHSAEINGGNSGGGLFDANGNIIGLVNGRYTASDNYIKSDQVIQGMNFAIPGSIVQSIANNIIYFSIANSAAGVTSLMRPKIGIFLENIMDSGRNSIPSNCYVVGKSLDINPELGAKSVYSIKVGTNTTSGFRNGDIIRSFAYRSVVVEFNKKFSLDSHIYNLRSGDVVKFFVERSGQAELVQIDITVSDFTPIF